MLGSMLSGHWARNTVEWQEAVLVLTDGSNVRNGLPGMSSELVIGRQSCSDLEVGRLRLGFHDSKGCTCKDSDAQVSGCKRY